MWLPGVAYTRDLMGTVGSKWGLSSYSHCYGYHSSTLSVGICSLLHYRCVFNSEYLSMCGSIQCIVVCQCVSLWLSLQSCMIEWPWGKLRQSLSGDANGLVSGGRDFNSLVPGSFEWNFKQVILKLILVIGDWDISCEIALRWFSLDLTDEKSTLVQVMAWCRQATSHYLSQCWPRSMSPYGVTRPQWVIECCINPLTSEKF